MQSVSLPRRAKKKKNTMHADVYRLQRYQATERVNQCCADSIHSVLEITT